MKGYSKRNSFLFINKWYWWIFYIPWLYIIYDSISETPNKIATYLLLGLPIILLALFPILQEVLYQLLRANSSKNIVMTLTVIKGVILTGYSCIFAYFNTAGPLAVVFWVCIACCSIAEFVLELVRIQRAYVSIRK